MAGKHFPIKIGKQIGKIGSKKGPEYGISLNSGGIPPEYSTKEAALAALDEVGRGGWRSHPSKLHWRGSAHFILV